MKTENEVREGLKLIEKTSADEFKRALRWVLDDES